MGLVKPEGCLMPRPITYYFSLLSPWAYIGHRLFMDIAARRELTVGYKPVVLTEVFADTGGLPLAKRHPVRQRYRMLELQRWRDKRGLRFTLKPAFWPFDVTLADRFVIAATVKGVDPGVFLASAFAAVWEGQRNLADEATVLELAAAARLPAAELLTLARAETTAAIYARNTSEAIADGAFGSPCFVLDGEVFWGQDRLELLDDALASGRAAYQASP
jgi:2-hydroxychromene-2-carboxylate isomerase